MKVSFLGMGIMGSRMAANLAKNGVELTVYNRSARKTEPLRELGATVAKSLDDAVSEADAVFTMLANPEAVQETIEAGMFSSMKKGSLWVDSSTVAPSDSRRFSNLAEQAGIRYLEAPVTGTKQPAESGDLVFLIGGSDDDLHEVAHLIDFMGQKYLKIGEHGDAASLKILVNLMLAQSIAAFSEAIHLADKMGLDPERTQEFLSNTPVVAPLIKNLIPKWKSGDRSANFPLYLMRKDLHLVTKTAFEVEAAMPLSAAVEQVFSSGLTAGLASEDLSSIFHHIREA